MLDDDVEAKVLSWTSIWGVTSAHTMLNCAQVRMYMILKSGFEVCRLWNIRGAMMHTCSFPLHLHTCYTRARTRARARKYVCTYVYVCLYT